MADRRQLFTEMRAQNFDAIRLSTYRAACKLRFVQKRCSLHLVDTWSLLEVFREQGLAGRADGTVTTGAMAPSGSGGGGVGDGGVSGGVGGGVGGVGVDMSVAQLERLVLSLYVQLNKKLSSQQQLSAEACSGLLLSFLLAAIDSEGLEKVTTFSVKVTLATMCGGKIVDKLRYLFSELSDGSGVLMWSRFDRFLQDVLALPTAVFEGPSFGYNAQTARACFPNPQRVTQSIFLDALMSEPPPQCLAWLPLIHRLCSAENVFHPVECSFCHSESMLGFRYRCQQCRSYQLCQDCFWRGQASSTHSNQHQMKEYTSWKSPAKKLGAAISKTLGCVSGRENSHALYPESPDNGAETTHVGLPWSHSSAMDGVVPSSNRSSVLMAESPGRSDDEHHLIARYAARLAAEDNRALAAGEISPLSMDVNKHQRQLIAELESRNREILQEIQRLRVEHERASRAPAAPPDRDHHSPALLTELRLLRQRKEELERRMSALQENRRELVQQLDSLMKLLKTQGSGSPRSSPGHTASRPIPTPIRTPSCGSSPAHTPQEPPPSPGGDPHTPPFSQGFRRNLCNDLLVAADSIASTMTSLVRELDSDISGDEDDGGFFPAARDRDPIRRQSGGGRREWEPPPHGLPSPPSPDLIILAPSSARRHLGGSGAPHCVQDEGLAAPSPRGAGEGCAGGEPLKHRVPPANSPLPLAHALESSSGQDEDLASGSSAGQHNNSGGGGGGGGGDEGGRVRRSLVQ